MKDQPNILLLITDQMRPFEIGCYGHSTVNTPNIDRLAAMGVRYEMATTPNPVCTAARSALLSGQYSRSCAGLLGCCSEPVAKRTSFPAKTLPEILQANGYHTALTGKWHIQPEPGVIGFDEAFYPLVAHSNRNQVYFDLERHGTLVNGFGPDAEVARSSEFFQRNGDQPWFLFHNFSLPHMPFYDVDDRYRTMYDPESLELRPNVVMDGVEAFDEEWFKIYLFDHHVTQKGMSPYLRTPDGYSLSQLYAEYCGMITCVDEQLGRLLDALEASGQMENTVILFTSDHGENMGSHHLWNKVSVNEEAVRVPFIAAAPGRLSPGVNESQVASLVDVAPTLLGLAGVDPEEAMHGEDLSSQLRGKNTVVRKGAAFTENLFGELAIRTPTHAYAAMTRTSDPGPEREWTDTEFLFTDLENDPYQFRNLAEIGEQEELRTELEQRVREWDRSTPWLEGSLGGVYGQGPQHDFPAPARGYSVSE